MNQQRSTVVGVFEDRLHADKAVDDLLKAGFRNDQIGVAMRNEEGTAETATSTDTDEEGSSAGSGAMAGALAGLGLGAIAGFGVLAGIIPVIGPAIAAGTLGVILSNAAAGAGIIGLVGALVGLGIPEEEATYYQSEFESGRTIVSVSAEGRADEATAIMQRHGAYDMNTRANTGATGRTATAAATGYEGRSSGGAVAGTGVRGDRDAGTIEVKEEELQVHKRPVDVGDVRVRKEVHTETKTIEVPVQHEEVVIERTPVHGRAASTASFGGNEEIRIPVREEQVDVTKHAVVKEEIQVGKRVVQDTERVTGQVRKEEVRIEQTGDAKVEGRDRSK